MSTSGNKNIYEIDMKLDINIYIHIYMIECA